MITAILNKKSEIIEISIEYHDYTDVFDKIDANKLFEHKFHDHAMETKNGFFFILFTICLLRNLKFSKVFKR